VGSALGWFAGAILRIRRRVVDENLARAFPEASRVWRRRTAVRSYRHLGREAAATLILEGSDAPELRERVQVEGLEHVRAPLSEGRGVVILSGHLGNWELGGAGVAARGIPLDVVVRRQSNPLFDERMRQTRERLGMRVVYRADATRSVLRTLRSGGAVALVADQNVREGGIFVDFFGVPASTTRGPALLAGRTGAAVVLAVPLSEPGSRARYRLEFIPLEPEPGLDPDDSVRALTRTYVSALEAAIRGAPSQYFWFHRRWRSRPDGEEPPVVGEVPPGPLHPEPSGDPP